VKVRPEEQGFDPDTFDAAAAESARRRGLELFDAGEYHAAHEELERCWLASEGADSEFYKGLIQAAICMHHFQRGNLEGARKLYAGQRRLLGPYLPAHQGLDLVRFLAEMQRALAPVLRARDGAMFREAERPRVLDTGP